jgi:hypothetical protein
MTAPRILHYPGSKWSMAEWIISHMPPHQTYLEPFFGSGAVFFTKAPSPLETINDIDGDVVNLFRVIRDRPDDLARLVYWTPYSRQEYINSYQLGGSWMTSSERGGFWCGAGWRGVYGRIARLDGVITSTLHICRTSLSRGNGSTCRKKFYRSPNGCKVYRSKISQHSN